MNEFPHRERIAALLMQALDSVGRKAEALRVFHQFREALIDNAGLGPSAELVAAARRRRLWSPVDAGPPTASAASSSRWGTRW